MASDERLGSDMLVSIEERITPDKKPEPKTEHQYLHGNLVRCPCGTVTLRSVHNGLCTECHIKGDKTECYESS